MRARSIALAVSVVMLSACASAPPNRWDTATEEDAAEWFCEQIEAVGLEQTVETFVTDESDAMTSNDQVATALLGANIAEREMCPEAAAGLTTAIQMRNARDMQ